MLSGLGTDIDDFTVPDHNGSLSVGYGDDGSVRDNIVVAVIGAARTGALVAAAHQRVAGQAVRIKVFFPLIGCRVRNGAV